jgi:elongation factor G
MSGVFNVLNPPAQLPDGVQQLAHDAREKLMEIDDSLMEKYLDGKEVKAEEVIAVLPKAIADRKIVPILCVCAPNDFGVKELADFISDFLPPPSADPGAPFAGRVFKSFSDRHVGRLAYIKVMSGAVKPEMPLTNMRTSQTARMGGLFKPFGKDQKPTTEVIAGDLCCVSKIDDLVASDTVRGVPTGESFAAMTFPAPMVSAAVAPKTKADEQRMSTALQRLADSDPTFKLKHDQLSGELVITAMSQMHLDIAIGRLKRKFDVEVVTKPPKIPFKETVLKSVDGHHKHKKQTGGRGQFAEIYIRLEPNVRDAGYEFVDDVKGGRVPREFIPAVDKGIQEAMVKGVVSGCPVVDVRVRLVDGKHHDVDSDNRSFHIAGSKAFKSAFLEAKPALLEPIVNLEVVFPSRFMGEITGNLNSRRGRIVGMDTDGDNQVIKAQVPMMEITNYSTDLRSMTGGEGWYSFTPSHYEVLPSHIAEGIIAANRKHEDEEE